MLKSKPMKQEGAKVTYRYYITWPKYKRVIVDFSHLVDVMNMCNLKLEGFAFIEGNYNAKDDFHHELGLILS